MKFGSRISNTLLRLAPPVLLALAYAGEAKAAQPLLDVDSCNAGPYTYNLLVNTTLATPDTIDWTGATNGNWTAAAPATAACSVLTTTTWNCAGMTVTVPAGSVTTATKVSISTPSAPSVITSNNLNVTITDAAMGTSSCTGNFTFAVTSTGGGWGDPHLTTVDGVHYDFQSAGEFTALREEGFVVQTRQAPVPTATTPITNPYTGITHCVAIYTAVAAKLGSTRVTLQPTPGAEPNPKSMELRVNGKLTQLGEAPMILYASAGDAGADAARGGTVDGTLTQHADGVLEITNARGTQLVVTPNYWENQKVWYLNLNVYGTSAHEGTMGSIAQKSWLPALPDGSSVGPRPESASDRYQALYEKFADAWRVTDPTSLFDYAPGTNTATFTRDEWPRNNPQSCAIEGQTSAVAVTEQVAQQECAGVKNTLDKADCVFDVMITGNKGFAKSYETMRRFAPRASGWYTPLPVKDTTPPAPCPPSTPCPPAVKPWWCWLAVALAILAAVLAFLLMRSKKN